MINITEDMVEEKKKYCYLREGSNNSLYNKIRNI